MPSFDFKCGACGCIWVDLVPRMDSLSVCERCGVRGVRQFSPTSNIVIPAWMKAGSDDGHREWVKSDAVQQGLRDGTYVPMSEV